MIRPKNYIIIFKTARTKIEDDFIKLLKPEQTSQRK